MGEQGRWEEERRGSVYGLLTTIKYDSSSPNYQTYW
jgi:hypothetical protein